MSEPMEELKEKIKGLYDYDIGDEEAAIAAWRITKFYEILLTADTRNKKKLKEPGADSLPGDHSNRRLHRKKKA